MNKQVRVVCAGVLVSASLTAGCGFHLRGQVVLPENLKQMALSCPRENSRNLCLNIEESLQQAGIQIIKTDDAVSVARLSIQDVKDQRRAVSIASDAGVAEYELSRSVRFTFTDAQGNPVISDGRTTQFQSYRFDETSVLGKDKEEEQIKEELNQLLSQDILNRVATSASKL
ncbi:LPS assembly lipoprotein LptE [Hahella ganghwensis]|uniref:LPS-assembly lipoprotein LptE n=1 Tax=Hahella ganghwensis TaxID=286420 RepID=UPI0012FB104E|nr:LPS assembly lipoprotein LptE [Hahella ganghwensis]